MLYWEQNVTRSIPGHFGAIIFGHGGGMCLKQEEAVEHLFGWLMGLSKSIKAYVDVWAISTSSRSTSMTFAMVAMSALAFMHIASNSFVLGGCWSSTVLVMCGSGLRPLEAWSLSEPALLRQAKLAPLPALAGLWLGLRFWKPGLWDNFFLYCIGLY